MLIFAVSVVIKELRDLHHQGQIHAPRSNSQASLHQGRVRCWINGDGQAELTPNGGFRNFSDFFNTFRACAKYRCHQWRNVCPHGAKNLRNVLSLAWKQQSASPVNTDSRNRQTLFSAKPKKPRKTQKVKTSETLKHVQNVSSLLRKLTFYHVSQTLANMPVNIG